MSSTAGFVRISGEPATPGFPLVAPEIRIDVRQSDGTLIPLRGVCSLDLHVGGAEIATAVMVIEVGELELAGLHIDRAAAIDDAPREGLPAAFRALQETDRLRLENIDLRRALALAESLYVADRTVSA